MAQDFYLYERKRKDRPSLWYCRFRGLDGRIGSPICTGQVERRKAEQWAVKQVGQEHALRRPKSAVFEDWAAPWWIYETCPYIAEKLADGYSISKTYAEARRSYLTNHLIPAFGKLRISALTPRLFRDFKMRLFQEQHLSPATINRILGTARVMLGYAVRMGELENNPVAPVKELKETPRERGILTLEEIRALFGAGAREKVWAGDLRHYGCGLLALTSGMRLGECQALQVQYVHPGYVQVLHSWDDRHGLSAPKWGSVRLVPVPKQTAEALADLLALRRWGAPLPTDTMFWGQDRDTPLTKTTILSQFKKALNRIGIEEPERRSRNLVFHSTRHTFNTLVRGKVPDEQLRRVTGHKSLTLSDTYDHPGIEHLQDVLQEQEKLFDLKG